MGTLIDVSGGVDYAMGHYPDAINIPYQKLMLYHDHYLNKKEAYYITCHKGIHSRKAVNMLEFLGYNVTQVLS